MKVGTPLICGPLAQPEKYAWMAFTCVTSSAAVLEVYSTVRLPFVGGMYFRSS